MTQSTLNPDNIYKEVVKEFVDAKDLVRQCMEEDARCRNDDRWLMLKVWQKQGIIVMIDFEKWKNVYNPETIRRVRQEIQSPEGECDLLPTDPNILKLRRYKEESIRRYYGDKSYIFREFQNKRYGIK